MKPECEKNGLEKVCDGLKSAVSWLVDNIKEILVVGLAVLAVVAVVALAIATFGLGAVAIATVVGAAAGLASQLITDIVSGFVTGNFKVSSPLNYISSAVGGAIGGIIMLPTGGVAGVSVFASKVFGNFALAATADVFVSTSLSEGTPMIFSKEKLSLGQWGSNVAVGTALSLVLAKGFDGFTTKFNKGLKNTGFKITERFAGSHSYRADYNRSIKRLIHKNSSLKNITYRTYRNGFMAEFTENIFSNPTNGVLGVGWDEIKELVYKITATDECIIIRKWYGRCVKVNFDDITKVVFATLSGKPVDATRIHIYKGKKKVLSLDPVMENFDKMKNYLLDHIDETKIDTIS